jgi:hypothetical protein
LFLFPGCHSPSPVPVSRLSLPITCSCFPVVAPHHPCQFPGCHSPSPVPVSRLILPIITCSCFRMSEEHVRLLLPESLGLWVLSIFPYSEM